jgi:DNA-binding MarR family transcriptional regulator
VFLTPTEAGRALYSSVVAAAHAVTAETLEPLEPAERAVFLRLLGKLT